MKVHKAKSEREIHRPLIIRTVVNKTIKHHLGIIVTDGVRTPIFSPKKIAADFEITCPDDWNRTEGAGSLLEVCKAATRELQKLKAKTISYEGYLITLRPNDALRPIDVFDFQLGQIRWRETP